jgi:hypothetical protein
MKRWNDEHPRAREGETFLPLPTTTRKTELGKNKNKKGNHNKKAKQETTHLKQRKTRKQNRSIELLGCLGVGHEGERRGEDGEREREGDAVEVRAAMT